MTGLFHDVFVILFMPHMDGRRLNGFNGKNARNIFSGTFCGG
jgi:hypothetical protein